MERDRILVTVKTYPTLSRKYGETVCTAGIREDGTWVRLYPVPFRRLDQSEQYRKFDWIEPRLQRNVSDIRPETYRPFDHADLVKVGHIDTDHNWRERREIVLGRARVWYNLADLIAAAKSNESSLAVFKPTHLRNFVWDEEDERDWNPERVRQMREATNQLELFADNTWRETFKIIPKLPYNFSYRFEDVAGKESTLQILDWEIGQLFWNCRRRVSTDAEALRLVREKYWGQFSRTDLHFFLGTTQQWHQVALNPWVIIGVFPIPFERQLGLL